MLEAQRVSRRFVALFARFIRKIVRASWGGHPSEKAASAHLVGAASILLVAIP